MDIRKVKKLIELLEESGIAEIEITEGEESVRISRYQNEVPAAPVVGHAPPPVQVAAPAATPAAAPPAAAAAEPAAAVAPKGEEPNGHKVLAPMVRVRYRRFLQPSVRVSA